MTSSATGSSPPRRGRPFTLALCNEVVRELSFERQCAVAAALGYDALEVAPFTLVDDPRDLTESDLARYRRTAQDAGVRISGLHWLLNVPDGLSITSSDRSVRDRTLDVMRTLVDACAALGGDVLVHGSPGQRTLSSDDPEGDAGRGREAFALIAERAQRAGVTYLIEPLSPQDTPFVTTVAEAAAIVREVGSPALQTMIDTRAAHFGEAEPAERVLERGLREGTIGHVHLNDGNSRAPGQGATRFAPILEVLLRRPYAGTVSVEPFVYEPDGPTVAARAVGYVDGLIEALTQRASPPEAD